MSKTTSQIANSASVNEHSDSHLTPAYQSYHAPEGCQGAKINNVHGGNSVAVGCAAHHTMQQHHMNTHLAGGSKKGTLNIHPLPSGGPPTVSPNANTKESYISAARSHASVKNVQNATGPAPSPEEIKQPWQEQKGGKSKKRRTYKKRGAKKYGTKRRDAKRRGTKKRTIKKKTKKNSKKTLSIKGILKKNKKKYTKKVRFSH